MTDESKVSPGGYSDAYGPNVAQILAQGSRIIRGRVPASVRAELRAAVRDGVLGRLPKDGLKPEIFFHPDHKNGAIEQQRAHAMYAIDCIKTVVAHGSERAEHDFNVMTGGTSP